MDQMEQNPSESSPGGEWELPAFSFAAAFRVGWGAFREHYPCLLVAGLVYLVFQVGIAAVGQSSVEVFEIDLLSPVAAALVGAPLSAGYLMLGVAAARGRRPQWQDLFLGFRRYWPMVWLGVVFGASGYVAVVIVPFVATELIEEVGFGAGGATVLVALTWLLMTSVVFAVMSRVVWALAAELDHWGPRPGPIDSLRISWRMTGGPRLADVLTLVLLTWLIGVAGLAACCFPAVIFAMPFTVAVYGAAYAMLAQESGLARSDRPRWCWNCGYDVSGLPLGRCPECGQEPRL